VNRQKRLARKCSLSVRLIRFSPSLSSLPPQVVERQYVWEASCAARDSEQVQQEAKQALENARARMAEIALQRDIHAEQGEFLLSRQMFEEVSFPV
jgi:hypothetical protein